MSYNIVSEKIFKQELCKWLLKNQRGCLMNDGETLEEYAEKYRLPELDYVHTQSFSDENGDLLTLLKSEIALSDWQTKGGNRPMKFEFYLVLKTLTDTPEVEPFPAGYIICS